MPVCGKSAGGTHMLSLWPVWVQSNRCPAALTPTHLNHAAVLKSNDVGEPSRAIRANLDSLESVAGVMLVSGVPAWFRR